jgi:uncharacterized protein YndB with AHSA1/START domain
VIDAVAAQGIDITDLSQEELMSLADITASIEIDASQERVWQTLTQAGLVEHWLGCVGFRPEIGALFYMQSNPQKRAANDATGATHCELELLQPPTLMRFSWFVPEFPETYVDIVVAPNSAAGCTVRLQHSGWDQFTPIDVQAIYDGLSAGWRSFGLPGLKRVAEGPVQRT